MQVVFDDLVEAGCQQIAVQNGSPPQFAAKHRRQFGKRVQQIGESQAVPSWLSSVGGFPKSA